MKKIRLLALVVLLPLLLFGAYMLYNELMDKYAPETIVAETETAEVAENADAEAATAPVELAPDFTVYDIDGNAVKLSDFIGKPVVINFWATWCGPCKTELPWFDQLHTRFGRDVEFLMVNLTDGQRDTKESVSGFVADNGYGFPVYYDTDSSAGISYNVSAIPVTVFIDANGEVTRTVTGVISEKLLTNMVIKMAGDAAE